jgi:colanic acid biosynthesis glycosyl transferase WcaI
MRILIISQCYWPDTASVAQHLGELCEALKENENEVVIVTSQFSYEDKSIRYSKYEIYKDVEINRIYHTHFGKNNIIGRLIDFLSFNVLACYPLFLANSKNIDVIMAMPPPPLLPFIGSLIAKAKKIPFVYWAMDLQPELSFATGLLNDGSLIGKLLNKVTKYTIKESGKIIALDSDMKKYLLKRGGQYNKIFVCPVWPVMSKYFMGNRLSNPFRIANNFNDKVVIMYSGNYGNAHPVDTLLEAARELRDEERIIFVFVGGGTQYSKVQYYKEELKCINIIQLPYQPKEYIHISLASADFHVVVLNEATVGFTHPNKIYGAMYVGRPIIFIGPEKSYAGKILLDNPGNLSFRDGQSKDLAEAIRKSILRLDDYNVIGEENRLYVQKYFNSDKLKRRMVEIISNHDSSK